MERTLQSLGRIRSVDVKKGTFEAVISSDAVARDDAIILTAGWQLDNFMRCPSILWGHDDLALPIGRALSVTKGEHELTAVGQIDLDDDHAAKIFRKLAKGFINATSVRWLPLKTETRQLDGKDVLTFVEQELLEFSLVSVPADPQALIMRAIQGHALGEPIDVRTFRPLGDLVDEIGRLLAARAR